MIWPGRLCNLYLLDDLQRFDQFLLLIGCGLCLAIAWNPIWGRFDALPGAELLASQALPDLQIRRDRVNG